MSERWRRRDSLERGAGMVHTVDLPDSEVVPIKRDALMFLLMQAGYTPAVEEPTT